MLTNLLNVFEGLVPMDPDTLLAALNILWQGLLAIFVVIGLIIISVKICALSIDKFNEWKKSREENAENTNGESNT